MRRSSRFLSLSRAMPEPDDSVNGLVIFRCAVIRCELLLLAQCVQNLIFEFAMNGYDLAQP